mmetsp:Transcript_237/g.298  ORF Transcript_237/g.298 Transcript_237/m.298 type:complete len:92 (-) Transcript_237:2989-3264(-)
MDWVLRPDRHDRGGAKFVPPEITRLRHICLPLKEGGSSCDLAVGETLVKQLTLPGDVGLWLLLDGENHPLIEFCGEPNMPRSPRRGLELLP